MLNIKVLDTFAIPITKYDILRSLGKVDVYADVVNDKKIILQRAKDADIVVVNKTPLTADIINAFEHVKLIVETASGFDNIDIKAAAANNIVVCTAPGYSTTSVAEQVFALILSLSRKIKLCIQQVAQAKWLAEPLIGTELAGKTIGIVGFGTIGKQVANIAQGFGMNIIAYTRNMDLSKLMQQADIVSLHLPHNKETDKIINESMLKLMRPGSMLINTARGGIIDEKALIKIAKQNKIYIGLDVLTIEPIEPNHELNNLSNVLLTPHVGWYTDEAIDRLMQITYNNIDGFYQNKPINVVNMF